MGADKVRDLAWNPSASPSPHREKTHLVHEQVIGQISLRIDLRPDAPSRQQQLPELAILCRQTCEDIGALHTDRLCGGLRANGGLGEKRRRASWRRSRSDVLGDDDLAGFNVAEDVPPAWSIGEGGVTDAGDVARTGGGGEMRR